MLVSYLIIPTVILFLILNVVFRVKIIRQYKALRNKRINIDAKLLLSSKKLKAFVNKEYPEHEFEILRFSRLLQTLIALTITGFLIILSIYLYMQFS